MYHGGLGSGWGGGGGGGGVRWGGCGWGGACGEGEGEGGVVGGELWNLVAVRQRKVLYQGVVGKGVVDAAAGSVRHTLTHMCANW